MPAVIEQQSELSDGTATEVAVNGWASRRLTAVRELAARVLQAALRDPSLRERGTG